MESLLGITHIIHAAYSGVVTLVHPFAVTQVAYPFMCAINFLLASFCMKPTSDPISHFARYTLSIYSRDLSWPSDSESFIAGSHPRLKQILRVAEFIWLGNFCAACSRSFHAFSSREPKRRTLLERWRPWHLISRYSHEQGHTCFSLFFPLTKRSVIVLTHSCLRMVHSGYRLNKVGCIPQDLVRELSHAGGFSFSGKFSFDRLWNSVLNIFH